MLYLLKSGLCLALLLAFYHLVLEREKMHQFNRFYLLGSVLFSFLAPGFIIYVEAKDTIENTINYVEKTEVVPLSFFDQYVTFQNILLVLYTVVSLIFLIRFVKNLHSIFQKIRTNKVIKSKYAKFVPVPDEISPHTFWNYIFINKEDYSSQKIEEEVFTHELAHVTQKHTIDVLLLETLQIVFWFNPLFFLLKKAVQLNHEFLADDKVISSHENIPKYQALLLNKASWDNTYYLASNLNYSLTKKRLLMMKTQNSNKVIYLKKIAVIPLLAGLVFLFANRVEAQTKKKKPEVIEIKVAEKKITDAQMKEYKDFMKGVNKNSIFKLKDVKRLGYLYSNMSQKQQNSVKNIYDLIPPPPKPAKIKVKEVKTKGRKPPKPVKITVKKGQKVLKEKLPPPPPPRKKHKEAKKRKLHKVVEIKKTAEVIDIIEEREELVEPTEDVHEREEIEIVESPHVREEVEVIETPVVIEEIKEHYKRASSKENFESFTKDGATFYLNGKKISNRKAKKYFNKKANQVKDIEIQKEYDRVLKVDINTKD